MSVGVTLAERFVLANARLLERHRTASLLHGGPVDPILRRAARLPQRRRRLRPRARARRPRARERAGRDPARARRAGRDRRARRSDGRRRRGLGRRRSPMPDGGVPFVLPDCRAVPARAVDGGGRRRLPDHVRAGRGALTRQARARRGSSAPARGAGRSWRIRASSHRVRGEVRPRLPRRRPRRVARRGRDRDAATARRRRRVDCRDRGHRRRAAHSARAVAVARLAQPRDLHPAADRRRSRPARARRSRTTAAGRSTGSAWSAGQSVEWRGIVTLLALATLSAHGRIDLPRAGS